MTDQEPLIKASHVSVSFGGLEVLSDLALTLFPGEVVLLRGENGSGKTTLLNVLGGHLNPDQGAVEYCLNHGRIVQSFGGCAPRDTESNSLLRRIGRTLFKRGRRSPELLARLGLSRTWQELRVFKNLSVVDNVSVAGQVQLGENPFNALFRPRASAQLERANSLRAKDRLGSAGLESVIGCLADRISLGQSKRLVIERALFADARVLFLDEPLSGLDGEGANRMIEILRQLSKDHGVTLVIVEHVANIPRILSFATAVWTLDRGKVISTPIEVAKADAEKSTGALERWLASTSSRGRELERSELVNGARLTVRRSGERPGQELLSISDLSPYRGKRPIFKDLSFALCKGEIALFEAPNGWGKTTAMDAISGLLTHYSGTVTVDHRNLNGRAPWVRRRAGLSYLRARDHSFNGLRVKEACRLSGICEKPRVLARLWERRIDRLSGGERQLVALVCAIEAPDVKVILMDEPFSALDAVRSAEMREAVLAKLEHVAVLIATPIASSDPNLTLGSEHSTGE